MQVVPALQSVRLNRQIDFESSGDLRHGMILLPQLIENCTCNTRMS